MLELEKGHSQWHDALQSAILFAIDPNGLGGINLKSYPGCVRNTWLKTVRSYMPHVDNFLRVPLNISDDRLLGGLDLAATLGTGRPVTENGLLAEAHGGVLLLPMAERITQALAARITTGLDLQKTIVQRDGMSLERPTSYGIIAFDESIESDEQPPAGLMDRLAFHTDIRSVRLHDTEGKLDCSADELAHASQLYSQVLVSQEIQEAFCQAALAFGIISLRVPQFAVKAARASAALAGRTEVTTEDAALAVRLVISPRAKSLPDVPSDLEDSDEHETPPDEELDKQDDTDQDRSDEEEVTPDINTMADILLDAAQSALPEGLLEQLRLQQSTSRRLVHSGQSKILKKSKQRGRSIGVKPGLPKSGARLNIIETLKAAAPWQKIRQFETKQSERTTDTRKLPYVKLRAEDFRITRLKDYMQTATIFVVDASGSSALNRLAEAKGAIELLLADCYIRRDYVALITFRAQGAELLLPPTRSLVRAKKCLAQLPGGGGTPMAAAIDAAISLAEAQQRKGFIPVLVFLSDGGANIARDGSHGRTKAEQDALSSAQNLRAMGFTSLFLDSAPRPQARAERLAEAMGAYYLPLPMADATSVSRVVKQTSQMAAK